MHYWNRTFLLNLVDDDYFHGYCQIKEAFRALTKDDNLLPYITYHDFRSSSDGIDICYT